MVCQDGFALPIIEPSRFWVAPELTITLELRLPGASNALWADRRVSSLDCAETEMVSSDDESESANVSEGPSGSVLEESEEGARLVQSEGDAATRDAVNAGGCSMSTPTSPFSIWALLTCGLLVIGRRRTQEMAN